MNFIDDPCISETNPKILSLEVEQNFFVVQLSEAKRVTALSVRESEIAVLLVKIGKYKDVAVAAGISLDSVRTYVRRIYRKFGIHDRHELKARMIREGLIQDLV